jgi:hypothetical protein
MAAGNYNIEIDEGAGYTKTMYLGRNGFPLDTTGFQAYLQMRNPDTDVLLLDLRTGTGGTPNCSITPGGVDGSLTLFIDHTVTAALSWTQAKYDMFVVAPGAQPKKYLQGSVKVNPSETVVP